MSWDDLKTVLSFTWNMLSTKSRIQAGLSSVPSSPKIPVHVLKNRKINIPKTLDVDTEQMKAAAHAFTEKKIADLTNMQLKCSTCDMYFESTVSQQETFIKKEFENIPSKCEKCRGQNCNQFTDTGTCSFGSNCKFLHDDTDDSW